MFSTGTVPAFEKNVANRCGSMVALVMITRRSGLRGSSRCRYPSRKSMLSDRSCASSMMIVSYADRSGSARDSASSMPSVISFTAVAGDV
jgi:hypothetical protein